MNATVWKLPTWAGQDTELLLGFFSRGERSKGNMDATNRSQSVFLKGRRAHAAGLAVTVPICNLTVLRGRNGMRRSVNQVPITWAVMGNKQGQHHGTILERDVP